MTAMATKTRRVAKPTKAHNFPASPPEAEFRRWTPDEVVALQLLPYSSARVLRDKCHRRELFHHRDGGRVTFTADDLRRNSEMGAQVPLTA
ncbi:hypothetical protein SUDANB145_07382 (plasmid) [Streptomyces sp. enrichment culture]|uniref:hypothetical protein n=1 Tax=Streptomyces sp. enrichment culture TaxID=1795815 RepID=UPI003F56F18A